MNTSSEIVPIQTDIELTATLPQEMVTAQHELIKWCENKLLSLKSQSDELKEAFELARDKQWNYKTLQTQYNKSKREITYYDKIKSALVAGYFIVPNFPIDMFAIRTTKENPDDKHECSYWGSHEQEAKELPQTVGEYKNPNPKVIRIPEKRDGDKIIQDAESYATDWEDINFPITMAKPFIMQAASQAMALKIFDQFGIMPSRKNEDPVIIGQIKFKNGYSTKIVSFMIAWHFNTNVL